MQDTVSDTISTPNGNPSTAWLHYEKPGEGQASNWAHRRPFLVCLGQAEEVGALLSALLRSDILMCSCVGTWR